MEIIKSIFGFYFWSVVIAFFLGFMLAGHFVVHSEPNSFPRFMALVPSAVGGDYNETLIMGEYVYEKAK